MSTPSAAPSSRAATEAALVESARLVFTRSGYDGAGVREIAGAVGVNAALVNRYFGSKRGLLRAVLDGAFRVGDLLVGERATLGARLARWLVRRRAAERFDPALVLLRSVGSAEALPELQAAFETQVALPLAVWLGPPDAQARAQAITAVLFGAALVRDALAPTTSRRADEGADDAEAFAAHLGAALQRLIDG